MPVRTARLVTIARVAAVALVAAGAATHADQAHAAPRTAAATAVSVSPATATAGATLRLSGHAGSGATGNKATVEIAFRKAGATGFQRVVTTTSSDRGTYTATVRAAASGTFRAAYLGNPHRKPTTGYADVTVYKTVTSAVTLLDVERADADCLSGPCTFTGATLTLGPGPVHVARTLDCDQPKAGETIAFTDSPDNTLPTTTTYPTGDGWRTFPFGAGPDTFDLTPTARTGHFHIVVSSGRYNAGPTGCTWSVTATQQVTKRVRL